MLALLDVPSPGVSLLALAPSPGSQWKDPPTALAQAPLEQRENPAERCPRRHHGAESPISDRFNGVPPD